MEAYVYCTFIVGFFQEADNWTTLSTDVEEVFDSQDIQAVSNLTLVLEAINGFLGN